MEFGDNEVVTDFLLCIIKNYRVKTFISKMKKDHGLPRAEK